MFMQIGIGFLDLMTQMLMMDWQTIVYNNRSYKLEYKTISYIIVLCTYVSIRWDLNKTIKIELLFSNKILAMVGIRRMDILFKKYCHQIKLLAKFIICRNSHFSKLQNKCFQKFLVLALIWRSDIMWLWQNLSHF